MIHVGDTCPADGKQRNAHGVLGRRHTGMEISRYGFIDAECRGVQRVLDGIIQRRLLIGLLVPGSRIVIAVNSEEVHLRGGCLQINIDIVF